MASGGTSFRAGGAVAPPPDFVQRGQCGIFVLSNFQVQCKLHLHFHNVIEHKGLVQLCVLVHFIMLSCPK